MRDLTEASIKKLKVNELKAELSRRGLRTHGKKDDLLKRLLETLVEKEDVSDSGNDVPMEADDQESVVGATSQGNESEAAIECGVNQDDTHTSEEIVNEASPLAESESADSSTPVETPAVILEEIVDAGDGDAPMGSESTVHIQSKVDNASNAVGTTFQDNESETAIGSGVNQGDTHVSEETSSLPEAEGEDSDAPVQTSAISKELLDHGASVDADAPMGSESTDHTKSIADSSNAEPNCSEQEVSRKRSSEENEDGDKRAKRRNLALGNQPLLKLLVPNYAAGRLIGKGGSLLTELQSKYGGNLRLSANKEFYPGTDERVVVITGEVTQIIDINNHIMEIVCSKSHPGNIRDKQVKIVLTNFVAGLLLGKGGEKVKAIQEETKASLRISQREGSRVAGEQVLTMSGSIDECTKGCRMVIERMATDESNMKNTKLRYANSGTGISVNYGHSSNLYSSHNARSYRMGGSLNYIGKIQLKTTVHVQMEVPDNLVTVLMGKQGRTIKELIQVSGARLKFSDKNDFVPGTTNRILTITGSMKQVQTAYSLVNLKVG